MLKKETLTYDWFRLKKKYDKHLPQLKTLAKGTVSIDDFKQSLIDYITSYVSINNNDYALREGAKKRLLRLIRYDGKTVFELSTEQPMTIQTIDWLWQFLRGELKGDIPCDLFIDLFHLFLDLDHPKEKKLLRSNLNKMMKRWPSGLEKDIIAIRQANKERIIELLVSKIEGRKSTTSKYRFEENDTVEQKREKVYSWWNSYKFHLAMAIKSPTELNLFLDKTLSDETLEVLRKGRKKGMPFFITPYYVSLLNTSNDGYNDLTIRSYILYSRELVETYGNIKAWEREDVVEPDKPNAAGWYIPEGGNIHRRYPEVAILIPDSIGRACGGLCASCQRMYDFQSERLNFNFEKLKPTETWDKKLRRLMKYFEEDTQLRDILITGGDALMSQDQTLRKILNAICVMAERKRTANLSLPDGEKHAEIQRIRLGSRLLAYLPFRVTDKLVAILKEFRERAMEVGIKQFIIQTHFESPLEVTVEAQKAIKDILSSGWFITNQLVFNVAASRKGHTAQLRKVLNQMGVLCYYTFSVKGFHENYAVYAPISRSIQEMSEEKIFGIVSDEKKEEFNKVIFSSEELPKALGRYLKKNNLPFASTDRSVLNLPAIGKSMTFKTVGITLEGKRIHIFKHDETRLHSPILDKMGEIFIVENKSIAAYLRQLDEIGENVKEYRTIWQYTEGVTEPTFRVYDYPDYPFQTTSRMTNIELEDKINQQ